MALPRTRLLVAASRVIAPKCQTAPAICAALSATRYARFHTRPILNSTEAFHSQLQNLPASLLPKGSPRTPQTLTEKIVQRYTVGLPEGKLVQAGDYVSIQPKHLLTHDNTWPVEIKFQSLGASKIHNTRQPVFALDHDAQNKSESLEVPKVLERLREAFPAGLKPQSSAPEVVEPSLNRESLDTPPSPIKENKKILTRRTGWILTWNMRKSEIEVIEAGGATFIAKVGALPPTVQEIVARGGLEKWVKSQLATNS